MSAKTKILILGGGYAGVTAAVGLRKLAAAGQVDVTLVNQSNLHYLTTLLHHAILEPIDVDKVTVYLPDFLAPEIDFIHGKVQVIHGDKSQVEIETRQGVKTLEYDYLIVALGWEPEYFGIPGLRENTFVLQDLHGAHQIHDHIEDAFRAFDEHPDEKWRTNILVAGAAFTGIEIAFEIADLVPKLAKEYAVDPADVHISMVGIFLPEFDDVIAQYAKEELIMAGIEIKPGALIEKLEGNMVQLKNDSALQEGVIVWAGGIRANSTVAHSGFATDRKGRAYVDETLRGRDFKNVFFIGDCGLAMDPEGKPLPQTAQFAVQQGAYIAKAIKTILAGKELSPYKSRNLGMFLSIGRKAGLGILYIGKRKFRFKGKVAKFLKRSAGYRYLMTIGGPWLALKKFFT